MKIINQFPPNIDEIRKVLKDVPDTMLFCFGDTIYNPSGSVIYPFVEAHEECHAKQQGKDPREWWRRYLVDPSFRASQEIPAHQIEYQAAKVFIKDRNKLHGFLVRRAMELSGPAYGSIMSFQEALEAIKRKEIFKFKV